VFTPHHGRQTLIHYEAKRRRFAQSLPRLGVIEVFDGRFRERFAKRRHPFLPPSSSKTMSFFIGLMFCV
jgi:hypothetical protein